MFFFGLVVFVLISCFNQLLYQSSQPVLPNFKNELLNAFACSGGMSRKNWAVFMTTV